MPAKRPAPTFPMVRPMSWRLARGPAAAPHARAWLQARVKRLMWENEDVGRVRKDALICMCIQRRARSRARADPMIFSPRAVAGDLSELQRRACRHSWRTWPAKALSTRGARRRAQPLARRSCGCFPTTCACRLCGERVLVARVAVGLTGASAVAVRARRQQVSDSISWATSSALPCSWHGFHCTGVRAARGRPPSGAAGTLLAARMRALRARRPAEKSAGRSGVNPNVHPGQLVQAEGDCVDGADGRPKLGEDGAGGGGVHALQTALGRRAGRTSRSQRRRRCCAAKHDAPSRQRARHLCPRLRGVAPHLQRAQLGRRGRRAARGSLRARRVD